VIESFGQIRYHQNHWRIQCEPHVRTRLKRVFPRVPQHAADVTILSDTPENCRELEWFLQRYPMTVPHQGHQGVRGIPAPRRGSCCRRRKRSRSPGSSAGSSRVLIMSLRSGAGVDGLQESGVRCRTVVFGELDWSPGVHEQCIGRVHRDGQGDPVLAYFLVADDGADPIMIDVLGVKREQIEGVRNPNRALAERIDTGENSIKRVARAFLERQGETG
jgi:hypothetical protein